MTVTDLGHYAPQIHIAVCLVLMVGLSLPTVQRPHSWHMSLFILAVMAAINIAAGAYYAEFISYETLQKSGGSFDDLTTKAYRAWKMNFARVYSFLGALDLLTLALVRYFSQRGRRTIAILMASFAVVHLLTSIKIVAGLLATGEGATLFLPVFQWLDLHSSTNYIYSNYDLLIRYLNVLQIAILTIGIRDDWHRGNITAFVRGIVFFARGRSRISGLGRICHLVQFKKPSKRIQTW